MISNLREDEQHQHKNGLGWVANTARVDDTVYVGPYAIVYGQAELTERVRVVDTAAVSGHAQLSGDVKVVGNRWIDGTFKAHSGTFRENAKTKTEAKRLHAAEDKDVEPGLRDTGFDIESGLR
jgi:acyl-[acyl carrier protein]--UDP-N-acetylglucosamine O-acyltransferase